VDSIATTCSGSTITFGPTSNLFVKYQYDASTKHSDPIVADVTGDPHPEIFFVNSDGSLIALYFVNTTGTGTFQRLWQPLSPSFIWTWSPVVSVAVSKVPNTNQWILCGIADDNQNLYCVDASNGTKLLSLPLKVTINDVSAVSIERLFQSDTNNVFIITPSGVFQYNSTSGGSVHCYFPNLSGSTQYRGTIPHAVDINLDGNAEIFLGGCMYSPFNCSRLYCATSSDHVITAVANIDTRDPDGEVVVSNPNAPPSHNPIAVYDHNLGLLWGKRQQSRAPPVVADFDGDGIPDVSVSDATSARVSIFNGEGGLMRSIPCDSCVYGSAFDFENDEAYEFIYCGHFCLIISRDWKIQFGMNDRYTSLPIISDVDLDGMADIIVLGQNTLGVFNSDATWARSGIIWNQNAFNDMNYNPVNYYPNVTRVSGWFRARPALCTPVSSTPSTTNSIQPSISASSSLSTTAQTTMTSPSVTSDASGTPLPLATSLSSKTTVTPRLPTPSTTIVNPICDHNLVLCPSGQCESTLSMCQGEPDFTKPISDMSYTVTEQDKHKGIVLHLANGDNGGVGRLEFAPNMLHPGWNISIRTVDDSSTKSSNSGNCGDRELEAVSRVLEIQVTDERGRPVKQFNNSFQLSLYAVLNEHLTKDACLGYSNNDNEGWKCDGTTRINSTGSQSVWLVDTTSDHLTSFAVLLGSFEGGCGWGWIEIASLVMLGCALCFINFVTALYCTVPAFRAIIRGGNEEVIMRGIQKAIARPHSEDKRNNL